jgi:hypothetical protein
VPLAPEAGMTAPEPGDLPGVRATSDRLFDLIARISTGTPPDQARAEVEATAPLQRPSPKADVQGLLGDAPEAPQSFLSWLSRADPESTTGLGKELLQDYAENPDMAPYLWQVVEEAVADGNDSVPPELARMAKGKAKASGDLPVPKLET